MQAGRREPAGEGWDSSDPPARGSAQLAETRGVRHEGGGKHTPQGLPAALPWGPGLSPAPVSPQTAAGEEDGAAS